MVHNSISFTADLIAKSRDARYIDNHIVSADECSFFLLSVSARGENLADIFKPINNALFLSETLHVCHGGFERLEIWLESLWKGQYTYVYHVQSKSVIKAT